MRGRIGEGADGLEQFDDRARPAVRHDQRQRVLVRRLHVDEVDVQPVDLGLELRQRVQSRFAPAPVVLGRPVAGELLCCCQLHALGPIGDEFLGRPTSRIDAAAQFLDLAFRDVDSERADLGLCACARGVTHDRFPSLSPSHNGSSGLAQLVKCERLLRVGGKRPRAVAASFEQPGLDDEVDSRCGGAHADLAHFNETVHVRADTCVAAMVNRDVAKAQATVELALPGAGSFDRVAAARTAARRASDRRGNPRYWASVELVAHGG